MVFRLIITFVTPFAMPFEMAHQMASDFVQFKWQSKMAV